MVKGRRIPPVSPLDLSEMNPTGKRWRYTADKLSELHDEVELLQRQAVNHTKIVEAQRREIRILAAAVKRLAQPANVYVPTVTQNGGEGQTSSKKSLTLP